MKTLELILRWTTAAAAAVLLVGLLWGVVRSHGRTIGRSTGRADTMLQPWVQLLVGVAFFGTAFLLWRPLAQDMPPMPTATVVGALLALFGMALAAWGRFTLGALYDVSSASGARLYADHRLITNGPFAIVRHPMYVGIEIASVGGLLLYRTWTMVFLIVAFLGLVVRARREDELLHEAFGEQWEAYRDRVPAWFPRFERRQPDR